MESNALNTLLVLITFFGASKIFGWSHILLSCVIHKVPCLKHRLVGMVRTWFSLKSIYNCGVAIEKGLTGLSLPIVYLDRSTTHHQAPLTFSKQLSPICLKTLSLVVKSHLGSRLDFNNKKRYLISILTIHFIKQWFPLPGIKNNDPNNEDSDYSNRCSDDAFL